MTGAVPYRAFRELYNFLPRKDPVRVMVCMLALTGCRLSELNLMRTSGLVNHGIYWRLGKNQRSWRFEPLPEWYLKELSEYMAEHRRSSDHLFGPIGTTLLRYFNRDVRPHLGREWQEQQAYFGNIKNRTYALQLHGLRKSFATTIFWRELRHWGEAHAALLFASKRLKHSSEHLTAHHYLQHVEHIDVEMWDQFLDAEIVLEEQRRLMDFEPPCRVRG